MGPRVREDDVALCIPSENADAKKAYAPKRVSLICYCEFVVGRAGFEPATNGLKVRCSTS
jgi:hypothetical protein